MVVFSLRIKVTIQLIKDFIHKGSINLKPTELVMEELKWKYLIRSSLEPKNIMMTGPMVVVRPWPKHKLALDRPDFYFNLGATQDPRATLIGNTHFDKGKGTFFSESSFVTVSNSKLQIQLSS